MRTFILLAITLAAVGCKRPAQVAPIAVADPDVVAAFKGALAVVDPGDRVKVIAGPALNDRVRQSLRTIRPIVEATDVPSLDPKDLSGLPAGYLIVQSISINGQTALFEGVLGPVPARSRGNRIISMECGTGYHIELERTVSGWRARKTVITEC